GAGAERKSTAETRRQKQLKATNNEPFEQASRNGTTQTARAKDLLLDFSASVIFHLQRAAAL
ncbi:hypothetical protein, partial [Salmonella enterica]|uniref:hypothetical protein n=1 Tax=Salmonella enterica TaxID=28901 RepID=UPI003D267DA1